MDGFIWFDRFFIPSISFVSNISFVKLSLNMSCNEFEIGGKMLCCSEGVRLKNDGYFYNFS